MRRYDVVTIFPAMFAALTEHGVTRRARERGLYELALHDPREYIGSVVSTKPLPSPHTTGEGGLRR
mgnify:CR=1 FL=1